MTELTVWHDGACPLCRPEIALMRRLDRRGAIRFVDVATAGAASCPVDRRALLARFHAREDGVLLSAVRRGRVRGDVARDPGAAAVQPGRTLPPGAALAGGDLSRLPERQARPSTAGPIGDAGMRPRSHPVGPGQESVWDYPRPAIAEPTAAHIVIAHRDRIIADTRSAVRTLETSHPPSYYIPPAAFAPGVLRRASGGGSFCEWKGDATYWDVVIDGVTLPRVGWSYASPTPAFAAIRDHIAFYAVPFDRCSVDGETVMPQPGGFYGGWITPGVVGPFKGMPNSRFW